ncbi:MAG: hypothetical protein AAB315_03475, partial [Pseudomonadota bacterium]
MKQHLAGLLVQALAGLRATGKLATDGEVRVDVEPTKSKEHGDFACSVALALAKAAKAKPRELAERIVKALPASPFVEKVEIAGPGFINFFLKQNAYQRVIANILDAGAGYVTFNLPGGGTATDNSTGSKIVASGLELLGNNATYSLGGAPQWIGWTGRSINAPTSAVHNSAQAGNPVLTVAGNLTGTSSVYLYTGTPNVAYVSGNGMNTDLAVGSVGGTNGL